MVGRSPNESPGWSVRGLVAKGEESGKNYLVAYFQIRSVGVRVYWVTPVLVTPLFRLPDEDVTKGY